MVEYASLTAALAGLFASLSVAIGPGRLPANDLSAAALVSAAARSSHVSSSQARGAFEAGPYHTPALRYLYSVGWVWADANATTCKAALLFGAQPSDAAAQAFQQAPKLVERLRTDRISLTRAAAPSGKASAPVARSGLRGSGPLADRPPRTVRRVDS